MRKILILILFVLLLTGCKNNNPKTGNITVDDSAFSTKVLHAGEKFKIDLTPFEKEYLFNTVKFNYNTSVIRINHKEELLALKLGETTVEVYLYYGDHLQVTLLLYKIIVIDYNDPQMIPIDNRHSLQIAITANPSGFYYINKDIDMGEHNFLGIGYFSGILINPNRYVIKNLVITKNTYRSAFIDKAENAYIDGLILENVKIKGKMNIEDGITDFTAGLVGDAKNCHISNVHITGEISNGEYVGGIIGCSYKSTLINSSFVGKISAGKYVGGLVGYYYRESAYASIKSGIIKNCFVRADISGGHLDTNSAHSLGGLVGFAKGGTFVSLYYSGTITPDNPDVDFHKPIIAYTDSYYQLINVYFVSNYELNDSYESTKISEASVYKLTHDELISGKVLKGLEEFTFIEGEYPFI